MAKGVPMEQVLEESRRLQDVIRRMSDHAVGLAEDLLEQAALMREEAGVAPAVDLEKREGSDDDS